MTKPGRAPGAGRLAFSAATAFLAFAAAISAQGQVIYCEDFNGSEATADSTGWNLGYVTSGGDSDTRAIAAGGLAGSGALVSSVHVTDGPNLSAISQFSSSTLLLPSGASAQNIWLTADITGNRTGGPFALILEDSSGHKISFHSQIATAGKFQHAGGLLANGTGDTSAFDYTSYNGYAISVAFEGAAAWANGTGTLTLDNVVLKMTAVAQTNYTQNFNAPDIQPSSVGWDGGFAYSGGDSETHEVTAAGPDGSGALTTYVNVTDPANLGAFTEYWSGTMTLPPGSDAYSLALTAEVTGSRAGVPFALKLNDHATPAKNITFNGVIAEAGRFQQIGGPLNLASSVSSSFNYASSGGYSIILAFNPGAAWAVGTNSLTIDNVVLRTITRNGTNYAQTFDAAGATASSVGWNGGNAYSGGNGASKSISPTGVGGSGALVTSVNVTNPAALGVWTEYWSGTMHLPNNSSSNSLVLTAQVTANRTAAPFSLRFNDHATPTSHYITFNGAIANAGTFQTIGGRLADANSVDPNFDYASTNGYSLMVTFNPSTNWLVGTATLTVDNVVLQTVGGASFPLSISRPAADVVLSWPTIAGKAYAVQFTDSLNDPTWFNLASPFTAAGATSSFTNSVTGISTRYYRIEAQ